MDDRACQAAARALEPEPAPREASLGQRYLREAPERDSAVGKFLKREGQNPTAQAIASISRWRRNRLIVSFSARNSLIGAGTWLIVTGTRNTVRQEGSAPVFRQLWSDP